MIKLGETIEVMVQFSQFTTGAAFAATGTPVGVIYKNGAANALTVTATIVNGAGEVGLWKFVFTPTGVAGFAAADRLFLRVTATVDGVAAAGVVWDNRIVAFDPDDTVRLGLTALPNAAADAAGGLPISDAGGLPMDRLDAAITSRSSHSAADVWTVGTRALTDKAGFSLAADQSAVTIGTVNALASGAIIVGAFAANSITASALAADAATEIGAAVRDTGSFLATDATYTIGKAMRDLRAYVRGGIIRTGYVYAYYNDNGDGSDPSAGTLLFSNRDGDSKRTTT